MKRSYFKSIGKVLLLLVLCSQIYLILSTSKNQGLDISTLFKTSTLYSQLPESISVDYSQVQLFLPFKVRIINPKITYKNDGIHTLKFDYIDVSWNFLNRKTLHLNQWKLTATHGSIFSDYYPDTIQDVTLIAHIQDNAFEIEHLNGVTNDKVLSLSVDQIPLSNFGAIELSNAKNTPSNLAHLKKTIKQVLLAFSQSINSHLTVDFELKENRPTLLSVGLTTDHITFANVELNNAYASSQFNGQDGMIFLQTEQIKYNQNKFIAQNSVASLDIRAYSLEQINFSSEILNARNHTMKNAYGTLAFRSPDSLACDAYFNFQDSPTKLFAHYPIHSKDPFQAKMLAYIDPDHLSFLETDAFDFPSFQDSILKSQLNLLFDEDFNVQKVIGKLHSDQIQSDALNFNYLNSHFTYIPNQIFNSKTYTHSKHGPFNINASINLNTEVYHFELFGFTNPKDYNSILPKWWSNMFQRFTYHEQSQSQGNFVFHGNFKNPIPDLLFGSVHAENLEYKKVFVTDADLMITSSNLFTDIQIKNASTKTGYAKGNVQLTVKRDAFQSPESVRLDLESKLELEDTKALFGNTVRNIITEFETETNPTVSLKAVLFNSYYKQHKNKSYYNLFIFSDQPVQFRQRTLDYLYADVFGRNGEHYIRNAEAGFANGQLAFSADITEAKTTDPQIRLIANLQNSDSEKAIHALFKEDSAEESLTENSEQLLSLELNSKGSLLNSHKHIGDGTLKITGKNLAKIHLLGPFSKALNELKIPIGSFGLNELQSRFYIKNETIAVHNLEINGDQTHIFGEGTYNIENNAIHFNVKMDLLKNANLSFSLLGTIGDLINPVTKLLSFKVTGTPQKQIWRSRYDPRNLFD